jgi:hypothetical protein
MYTVLIDGVCSLERVSVGRILFPPPLLLSFSKLGSVGKSMDDQKVLSFSNGNGNRNFNHA